MSLLRPALLTHPLRHTSPLANKPSGIEILESRIAPAALANYNLIDLNGVNGFTISGALSSDQAGTSVSNAGDVNGDGFDDLIIGAPVADPNNLTNSGASYLVFGKAEGFSSTLDLSTLNGSNGIRLTGGATSDRSGHSVSGAGDLNGDGFDDLIIGARGARTIGSPLLFGAGATFVVFGRADFTSTGGSFSLATLDGNNGFRLNGEAVLDSFGTSVSAAGDVNGDGVGDLLIGANKANIQRDVVLSDAGASYVVFGKKGGGFSAEINLPTLDGTNGFKLSGVAASNNTGAAVSAAGDVNGDGFGDLLIGAYRVNTNGTSSGASYLVFGQADFSATPNLSLSTLNGTNGFRIDGVAIGDSSGASVSAAGDVNGDGFADLIIGAPYADPNGSASGAAYVVFGQADFSATSGSFNLSSLNGTNGFKLSGIAAGFQAGNSVSGAGDLNGDGFDDVIIGSSRAGFLVASDTGESYVVFGKANFSASPNLNLSTLDGINGFKLTGVGPADLSGSSVSAAGDVNGDGFDDLIIGAPYADINASSNGAAYVLFGFDTGAVTHLGTSAGETLSGPPGANVMIGGQGADTLLGNGGADVLRGGLGDDLLTISDLSYARLDGGRGSDTLRLDGNGLALDLTTPGDHRITGIEQIDIRSSGGPSNSLILNLQKVLSLSRESNTLLVRNHPGDSVSIGDGWSFSNYERIGGVQFGVFTQGAATLKLENAPTGFFIDHATVLEGRSGTKNFVFTVTRGSGDLSGVATVDYTTVDYTTVSDTAEAALDFVAQTGTVVFGVGEATQTISIEIIGDLAAESDERFFVQLSNPSGSVMVSAQGVGTILNDDLASINPTVLDRIGSFELNAGIWASHAGDINGDGQDDLIIRDDNAGFYVIFGQASGFHPDSILTALDGTNGFKITLPIENAWNSYVLAAGDVNGDGFDDLLIDVPGESFVTSVVFGKADFSATAGSLDYANVDGSNGFKMVLASAVRNFGQVSAAGDVNGDGYDDFFIGAPQAEPQGFASGTGYVVFGKASFAGSGTLDLTTLDGTNGFLLNGGSSRSFAGASLSRAGDVNGDGFEDLLLRAGQLYSGSATTYLIFGKADFSANGGKIDLSNLGSRTGFDLGLFVGPAGDVNGDGFDDLLLRAYSAPETYLIFGRASFSAENFNSATLDGTNGVTFNDPGWFSQAFGDLNGDGFDDLLIHTFSGAYVVYGKADFSGPGASIDLGTLDSTNGYALNGFSTPSLANGGLGGSFAFNRGDLNGDGFNDLLFHGAIIFGFETGQVTHSITGLNETLTGTSGADVMLGSRGADILVSSGGADVIYGGAGDDILALSESGVARLSGGRGFDTIRLEGSGLALDLTTLQEGTLRGIEQIDLRGSESHSLSLNLQKVLSLSDESNTLIIRNLPGNPLSFGPGWVFGGQQSVGGVTFTVLTQGAAKLLVENIASSLAIVGGNMVEGDAGTTNLVFTVTRGGNDLSGTATVEFEAVSGTAIAGEDFVTQSGLVTFEPNVTSQTITIQITGEKKVERNETFLVKLSNPSGAQLLLSEAVGTILNEDFGLVIAADRKSATFLDADGDLVTVRTSKPVLDANDFTFRVIGDVSGGVQLEQLSLRDIGVAGWGTTLSITAKRGPLGGDGLVNVGAIDATGVSLGTVTIGGDLGQIDAGPLEVGGEALVRALGSLSVRSLGLLGTSTQNPDTSSLRSILLGGLGKLTVRTDLVGASLQATGETVEENPIRVSIGSVTIGGSLIGDSAPLSGSITSSNLIGAVTIGGSLIAGTGTGSASLSANSIASVTIGGSLLGLGAHTAVISAGSKLGPVAIKQNVRGELAGSGVISSDVITSVKIGGDLIGQGNAGSIYGRVVGAVTIGGNLESSGGERTGIQAEETLGLVTIGGNLFGTDSTGIVAGSHLKGISIGGSARGLKLESGQGNIGAITVKGNLIATTIYAPGLAVEGGVSINGKVGPIVIGGAARGSDGLSPSQWVAQSFSSLKVGGTVFPLSAGFNESHSIGAAGNLILTENNSLEPKGYEVPLPDTSEVTFSNFNKTATFFDGDGDRVTVTTNTGMFEPSNFITVAGPNGGLLLQKLDLAYDADFFGKAASITIRATRSIHGGDGFVDVGAIDARGADLAAVSLKGDLGQIDAGDDNATTAAVGLLTVHSFGVRGTSTQLPGGSLESSLIGGVGTLTITTDLVHARIDALAPNGSVGGLEGQIKKITVGGSLIAGDGDYTGSITAAGKIGPVTIGGDLRGSSFSSGSILSEDSIGNVTVVGSLRGGAQDLSGSILATKVGAVIVRGDLLGGAGIRSGAITSTAGSITSVLIEGNLFGGSGDFSGSIVTTNGLTPDDGKMGAITISGSIFGGLNASTGILSASTIGAIKVGGDVRSFGSERVKITAEGIATPTTLKSALAIASVTIGGSVDSTDILAGHSIPGLLTNADVQIGAVKVGRNWTASNLLAGVGFDGTIFATGEQSTIAARIASIVIGGSAGGTLSAEDSFRFAAQQIGSFGLGTTTFPLVAATSENLAVGFTEDLRILEVG